MAMKISTEDCDFEGCTTGISIKGGDVELVMKRTSFAGTKHGVVAQDEPKGSGGFVGAIATGVAATAIGRILGL